MEREEEIKIIIRHLKNDVQNTADKYPALFEETIIKNGALLVKYNEELKQLEKYK